MITPAIRYISSFQDNTTSSSIPVPTPLMVDGRIWDQKNLNVSEYRSGRVIPQVKTGWIGLTTGAWRYYNDNPASATVYGRLYNWYALMGIYDAASLADPSLRDNIAPIGWEVATYGEWITLRNILGRSVAAIALKESGPSHWGPANTGTNSSYFTALPGGFKPGNSNSGFNNLGSIGYWWSKDAPSVQNFTLSNVSNSLGAETAGSNRGSSIRLIKQSGVIPNFTTTFPTLITSTSFSGTGGNIPTTYSGNITERGVVWSTSPDPTIILPTKIIGSATNPYTVNITGLTFNTLYYVRAYVIDSVAGAIYADALSIYTFNSVPTLSTNSVIQITTNFAESGGVIDNDGGFSITAKGVVWSTSPFPTVALATKTNNGSGNNNFVSEMTGLTLNTKYYVRAYATNSSSTGYGNQVEFTTLAVPFLNLIFDQYQAYHAYSLRQLSDTYNYKCLRVRRTTGAPAPVTTTTVDVFFNSYNAIGLNNDIRYVSGAETAALNLGDFAAALVSGYENPDGVNTNLNIFISIWYDQSGNGKNTPQATLSSQPRIISDGFLESGVRFSGGQQLNLADSSVSYNSESVYIVGSATSTNTMNFYGQGIFNTNARLFIGRAGGIWYDNNGSLTVSTTFLTPQFVANTTRLYELICGPSTTSAYSNGVQLSPSSVPSLNVTNSHIRIGANSSPNIASNGLTNEVICLVTSTPSRTEIETNINSYYNIW